MKTINCFKHSNIGHQIHQLRKNFDSNIVGFEGGKIWRAKQKNEKQLMTFDIDDVGNVRNYFIIVDISWKNNTVRKKNTRSS